MPAVAMLVLGLLGTAWLGTRPQDGVGPLAAVFPPWWSGPDAFRAAATADAAIVRTGAWPALVIVQPTGPGVPERLRAAGAWLVLDGRALGDCAARG